MSKFDPVLRRIITTWVKVGCRARKKEQRPRIRGRCGVVATTGFEPVTKGL
jgi:hypothetical protein